MTMEVTLFHVLTGLIGGLIRGLVGITKNQTFTPDKFTLSTTGKFQGAKTFYICSAQGDVVMKKEVSAGMKSMDFDISHLKPGYYVLFSQDKKYIFRVLKS